MTLLRTESLSMEFGGLRSLDQLNLTIHKGTIHGIIGPNGAGKTTLFNVLTGIYQPVSGSIYFNDEEITGFLPEKVARRGLVRTFQNIKLFKNISVVENIMIGFHMQTQSNIFDAIFQTRRARQEKMHVKEHSYHILEIIGLASKENWPAGNLSYGEQRRLEIGRTLATNPKLLLLDEPAAGMNIQETANLTEFIQGLTHKNKITILLIEHDMRLMMKISDFITVLNHGKKIAEGVPKLIQKDSQVIEAYLGKGKV